MIVHIVEIGFGVSHTEADAVTYTSPDGHSGAWASGGKSEFVPYLSIGVRYAVPVCQRLLLPIGVYYRALDYGTESSPAARIGIQWLF